MAKRGQRQIYRYRPLGEGGGTQSRGTVVTILRHFAVLRKRHPDAVWFHAKILGPDRGKVAQLVAAHIVTRLLQSNPDGLAEWTARHGGGPPHDEPTREMLEAYLISDFADESNETRLQGAVVEHLWACMAEGLDGVWGMPIHVEHDHVSVLDPGGDGLSLYNTETPDLRFRLWESKRHDSATRSVTEAVTGASSQLKDNAAEYLARLSKPLQHNGDPRIRELAGKIVKLWTTQDPAAGVGVSVGTAAREPLPDHPFQGLRKTFAHFRALGRREGLIIEIPDLAEFARDVRAEILKGIE